MRDWQNEQFQLEFEKPNTDSGVAEYEVGLGSFSLKFDLLHQLSIRAVSEGNWYRQLATLQVEQTRT